MRSDVSFTAESTVVRMTWSSVVMAVCAYSAIAVLLTFPLVLHLSSVVPHDVGDPMLSTAILWWNAHVLPLTERWWNGFAFYPAPGFMALSDARLGESLLATPLQWLGCSPVTSYNVTLLATYPLCAIAAHWRAREAARCRGHLRPGICLLPVPRRASPASRAAGSVRDAGRSRHVASVPGDA